MRLSRKPSRTVDEENPYWMSFSDIMSVLLIIFILASVALIVQLMEIQEQLEAQKEAFTQEIVELKRAEEVRRNILREAAETLQRQGIQVTVSENDTVLSIPNDILGFNAGQFTLGKRYQETAREIGLVLGSVIKRDGRIGYLDTVFIEGHTDNRPFSGFMGTGNWGLSTFRAISLWQYWAERLPAGHQLDQLSNASGDPLFSVSGYGATRPMTDHQESEEEYRQNRRINIRFTIRRPSSADYQAVQQRFKENSL